MAELLTDEIIIEKLEPLSYIFNIPTEKVLHPFLVCRMGDLKRFGISLVLKDTKQSRRGHSESDSFRIG